MNAAITRIACVLRVIAGDRNSAPRASGLREVRALRAMRVMQAEFSPSPIRPTIYDRFPLPLCAGFKKSPASPASPANRRSGPVWLSVCVRLITCTITCRPDDRLRASHEGVTNRDESVRRLIHFCNPKETPDMTATMLIPPGTLTLDEFEDALLFAGRVNGPAALFDAWFGRQISPEALTAVIGSVWTMAEYPDRCLTHATWRELFTAAGFTIDGAPAKRPAEPVELWRGTVPERRRDWSWTTDRAVAERFAFGHVRGRPDGRLYRVLAPTDALLCSNTERGEAEYVLDTRGLRIVEVARS